MTPLEQLVWAAAFAQASSENHQAHTCAQRAEAAVQKLRAVEASKPDEPGEYEQLIANTCSREEAKRRMEWAQTTLARMGIGSPWRLVWSNTPTQGALIVLRRKVDDDTWDRMLRDNPDLYRCGDFAFDIDRWERLTPDYAWRMGFTEYMELPK